MNERFRLQHKFWLDMSKSDEAQLADQIDELKQTRAYSKTIRDGIRLICDLRAGRLEVLFELFPWVRAEFLEYMQSLQPTAPAVDTEVKTQLERLEQLLRQQGSPPAPPAGGPKPLAVTSTAPPVFDEDEDADLLVVKPASGGSNSTERFLRAAFALQGMEYRG